MKTKTQYEPGKVYVDGACVFTVNDRGTNAWVASVQPGFDDNGDRLSSAECEAVARKLGAADALLECLCDGGVSGDGGTTKHLLSDTLREIAKFLEETAIVAQDDAIDHAAWLRGKAQDIEAAIALASAAPAEGGAR